MVLGNVKKSTSISFVPYFNTLRDLNLNNLFLSLASNNKLLWIFVKYVRYDEYLQLSNSVVLGIDCRDQLWCRKKSIVASFRCLFTFIRHKTNYLIATTYSRHQIDVSLFAVYL